MTLLGSGLFGQKEISFSRSALTGCCVLSDYLYPRRDTPILASSQPVSSQLRASKPSSAERRAVPFRYGLFSRSRCERFFSFEGGLVFAALTPDFSFIYFFLLIFPEAESKNCMAAGRCRHEYLAAPAGTTLSDKIFNSLTLPRKERESRPLPGAPSGRGASRPLPPGAGRGAGKGETVTRPPSPPSLPNRGVRFAPRGRESPPRARARPSEARESESPLHTKTISAQQKSPLISERLIF